MRRKPVAPLVHMDDASRVTFQVVLGGGVSGPRILAISDGNSDTNIITTQLTAKDDLQTAVMTPDLLVKAVTHLIGRA